MENEEGGPRPRRSSEQKRERERERERERNAQGEWCWWRGSEPGTALVYKLVVSMLPHDQLLGS